ncbi:Gsp Glutathionylspermidine synthase [uncultured Caudovirales phage]|uniref:Gsp Glutathionylspermidine synthase n=1 Tax=uncultured Caudovirales phage TaxID=2100421 RepID=A0A6J5NQ03_9CAUD|nr:Gsp Glutathionylspermidine synthase [uncultured Caudovirales phage]
MIRHSITSRSDWAEKLESLGVTYHSNGKPPEVPSLYWDESVAYEFKMDEILAIEKATEQLHFMCLEVVEYIVNKRPELMSKFDIPTEYRNYIRDSWNRADPYVMGRFDLAYNHQTGDIKMLEYNADTPTLAIETALVQWYWLQDCHTDADQFNSMHEKLIEQYRYLGSRMGDNRLVLSSIRKDFSAEEWNHVSYFKSLAEAAGLNTAQCDLEDIGWNSNYQEFLDLNNNVIRYWSKLYPWEWIAKEQFGKYLPLDKVGCVEPVWKMLCSNKAILPVLWELFPNHTLLLESKFEPLNVPYVAKPILSREGANIRINVDGKDVFNTLGSYGDQPVIYQEYFDTPRINDNQLVLCSWMVGEDPAGMIIRESDKKIIVDTARVVPHFIKG